MIQILQQKRLFTKELLPKHALETYSRGYSMLWLQFLSYLSFIIFGQAKGDTPPNKPFTLVQTCILFYFWNFENLPIPWDQRFRRWIFQKVAMQSTAWNENDIGLWIESHFFQIWNKLISAFFKSEINKNLLFHWDHFLICFQNFQRFFSGYKI